MTMIARVVLAALSVVALTAAQAPPRDGGPAAVPIGTGRISGVVQDDAERPIRRARVALSGDMRLQRRTITDDQGRFAFDTLPPGRFTLTAFKPAYPTASYGARRPNRPGAGLFLDPGEEASGLVITLPRGAVIAGTVYDAHGQPMPGVPVQPWEVRATLSGERIIDSPSTGGVATTADDQGRFRFYGLPAGEYTVGTSWFYSGLVTNVRVPTDAEIARAFAAALPSASAPSVPAIAPAEATHNYSKVFHPGTIDPLAAGTVQLAAGEERAGVDLHMQFRPMSKLVVVVTGPEGAVEDARLTLARVGKVSALNVNSVSSVPESGRYESASLAPGDYRVRVQVPRLGDRPPLWAVANVTLIDADPVTVNLALQPGLTVAGRVVVESTGQTPPPELTQLRVSLQGMSPGAWASLENAPVDGDGSFRQEDVFPAEFRVRVFLPPPVAAAWTVKSVTTGDRDVTDRAVAIEPDEIPPSFVITLTDQLTELSGTLIDPAGRPSTDYFVVIASADRGHWLALSPRIASTRPDRNGRFVFRNLPAGEYRLAATTDLVPRDLQETAALEALLPQGVPVTLGVGEKKTIDLRVAGQ
jgi:hypothetical protein